MNTITITRRSSGGFTVVLTTDDGTRTKYTSMLEYVSFESGVKLVDPSGDQNSYGTHKADEWTINGVTNFSTTQSVCNALDAIGLSQKVQLVDTSGVDASGRFRTLKTLVTRPANVTAVIATGKLIDVSGNVSSFTNANKAAGAGVRIVDTRVQTNDTGLAGKTLNIHLYDTSVTPGNYNDAFALDDANASKRRGKISVQFDSTGNLSKVASNMYDSIILNPTGTTIYFIVECVEGYTPSENSTWLEVELGVLQTA